MSALRRDALAGSVVLAGAGTDRLLASLLDLGARPAEASEAGSLALIHVAAGGAADARGGQLAQTLGAALGAAQAAYTRLDESGCLLFLLVGDTRTDTPVAAAITSLTRTLALEWAPKHRVNAIVCERLADASGVAAMVGGRAGRVVTGAVVSARRRPTVVGVGWQTTGELGAD